MKQTILNLFTRKMVAFYFSQFVVFWLALAGKLSGDNFIIIEPVIVGVFVTGNVWSKKFTGKTEEVKP